MLRVFSVVLALMLGPAAGSGAMAQEIGLPVQPYFGLRLGFPFLTGVNAGVDFGPFGVRAVAEAFWRLGEAR